MLDGICSMEVVQLYSFNNSFNNIQAAGGIEFFARLRNAAHSAQPCVSQARRHFFSNQNARQPP